MSQSSQKIVRRRVVLYFFVFIALILFYLWKMDSSWVGNKQVHTLMELTATLLALFVGILALIRYYTKRETLFLFIGAAFLGTAFLDGYHTIVTSKFFDQLFPSSPESLIPWSWNASRYFLSINMFVSWFFWKAKEKYGKKWELLPTTVYISVGIYTIVSFIFFAFYSLPRAYYSGFFGRPQEYGAALFFLMALIGYLHKGGWKENSFEHWLVLSLIVGFISQAVFMPFSFQLFDFQFDWAHLLKKLSYIFVLIGLFINMYQVFKKEGDFTKKLRRTKKKARKRK